MKAKVAVKPRDLAEYTFLVMFSLFVFYVAVTPHKQKNQYIHSILYSAE